MGRLIRKTRSAGGVIVNAEGKVVLVSKRGISWSFPKGHVEAKETILMAARREILEESGIEQLTLIKKLGTYKRLKVNKNKGKGELKVITLFLFTTTIEKLVPRDPTHPEARWVTLEKAEQMLTYGKDKKFFNKIKNQIPNHQPKPKF